MAQLGELDAEAWQDFGTLAIQGQVAFQVLERLKRPDLEATVPAAVRARLRAVVQRQTGRLLASQASLREVLQACHEAVIPVMVLKGAHLGEVIYGHPTARAMADIDLLFKPVDLPRATALFKALGFSIPANLDNLMDLAPARNEHSLYHPRWSTGLDIHWSLTLQSFEADIDEGPFWERAQPIPLAGTPALVMGLEDLLLFLCFHGVYHHQLAMVGPRLLVDIARVCAYSPALDWGRVTDRALALGWGRGVLLVLSLAREQVGAPVPIAVLERLAKDQKGLAEIQAVALDGLFEWMTLNAKQVIGRGFVHMANAPTLRERLRILWRRMLPPPEDVHLEFNLKPLAVRYGLYARHLRRMLFQHAGTLWRLWRGEAGRVAELQRHQQLARWLKGQAPT